MSTTAQIKKEHQIFQSYKNYKTSFDASIIGEKSNEALLRLPELDFPTTKTEYWKYTRVNKIIKSKFSFQKNKDEIDLTSFLIPELDCHTLVFVNGFFRKDLSCSTDETGLELMPLSEIQDHEVFTKHYGRLTKTDEELFSVLNTIYPTDGAYIFAKKNIRISKPVHLIFLSSGEDIMVQTRNLFVADQGAKLHVIVSEFSIGDKKSFTNGITEVVVGKNAAVTIDIIQKQNEVSFLLNQVDVTQAKDSRFIINTLSVEGAWIRNNLNIQVDGENCETHLNGTYSPKGKEHIDNHTVVDHKVPNCESHELYKGIIYDSATAVFNGKVFVRPDAQLTNAYQQNANILMSDTATVDSKPELEIYADDVKCSHGSTIGQFDEDALFYLMARGIAKENAKKLLVSAFVGDVLGKIDDLKVRSYVEGLF